MVAKGDEFNARSAQPGMSRRIASIRRLSFAQPA